MTKKEKELSLKLETALDENANLRADLQAEQKKNFALSYDAGIEKKRVQEDKKLLTGLQEKHKNFLAAVHRIESTNTRKEKASRWDQ